LPPETAVFRAQEQRERGFPPSTPAPDLRAVDYAIDERGAAARRLAAGGRARPPELRHWGTPSTIIRSWRSAVAMISASAVGSFGGASRIASAVETIAFTISPASSCRSAVVQRSR